MSNPEPTYYVYILTNKNNTTLYIGFTENLKKRLTQHIARDTNGFTKKYNLSKLVYFEKTHYANNGIKREKQIKNWKRQWKVNLINDMNPDWNDLSWMLGD
jgi:putative endonuclease